jgi:hypothetical protein
MSQFEHSSKSMRSLLLIFIMRSTNYLILNQDIRNLSANLFPFELERIKTVNSSVYQQQKSYNQLLFVHKLL